MSLEQEGVSGFSGRRGFIKLVAASAASALLPSCSEERRALGFQPSPSAQTPFITPNGDFFLVAVDPGFRPRFDLKSVHDRWRLELTGPGEDALRRIGYDALRERATREVLYTFECIGNRVGGQLIGNARWQVAPLRDLLAPLVTDATRSVMFEGLDDFYSSVSLERAIDDYAFVAIGMNGEPLPAGHGFPARVILPDLYGMKQPRWLRRISLLEDADTTSYWEKRGWAGEVPVKTISRIDPVGQAAAGRPLTFNGIAFAGKRGVQAVEISLDGGRHWQPCELVTGERPHVWSLWRYIWQRPTSGRHSLQVRAVDGRGIRQTAERQGRFPDGASGYHQLDLQFK